MNKLRRPIADDLMDQLESLAVATGKSQSSLAIEAIRAYLQQETWQIAEIRQALQEADAGDFAEAKDVEQIRKKWLGDAR